MEDLVRWLNTQLDIDAEKARAACEYASPDWHLDEDGETVLWWPPEPHIAEKEREKGLPVVSDRWRGETVGARIAPHIAEHDPARVLREIDAKRRLLAEWKLANAEAKYPDFMGGYSSGLDYAVQLAAAEYADRPGYDPEWAPRSQWGPPEQP
ncbi:DUF6221 family protein [Streptomyces caniscabiei]|uniref:DUF6221 family protein n=1 Tax=Streptomyces caniscabiei TaxID=2746961 RepID=UPI0029BD23B9|nr:DUF6221 family protein [Streptomyces caniscabiei]MDX3515918.1 DUF6221 family protein [Streptomyces caniscabiei]MDX3725098.1 DUF6221 family protein [Streptomyces caniscabiei]